MSQPQRSRPDKQPRLTDDEVEDLLARLRIHRQTLAIYLMQQAKLGSAYAPPAISFGILETRREIKRIKDILHDARIRVEDHPDDEPYNSYE